VFSLGMFIKQTFQEHPKICTLLLLCVMSLIAFGNAFPNSFHFDDIVGVVRNPAIRDLKNIPAYFTDPATFGLGRTREWRPILQITYALNYFMGGLNPAVFRSFNLLFHIGNAFLIFLIVTAICRQAPEKILGELHWSAALLALLSAVLFAVHTANSEAVDYIWARSSVLATFFYLLAFYARGPFSSEKLRSPLWHLGGLVSFALGIGSKATAVTLPATLFIYEFLFLNPRSLNPVNLFLAEPGRLKKYIPLGALSLAYVALRMVLFPRMVTSRFGVGGPRISPYTYLLTQFRAWVYYIKLFLWPHPLMIDFAGFGWSYSLWNSRVLLSLGLVLVILIFAWLIRKIHPLISFFLFWYFIALLPEASVIPLEDAVVGYRAYPAYVGLAVVVVMLSVLGPIWVGRVLQIGKKGKEWRFGLTYGSVAAVVLISLIVATIIRNRDWRNESILWSDVMSKDPTNPRPYMSLGLGYLVQGEYGSARQFFDKAIQLSPRVSHAFILRGYLSYRQDRNEEALDDFATALKLDSRSPYAFFYRGELYRKIGESDKALADYQAALHYMPYLTDAHLGIAMAYLDKEETVNATDACALLVKIDPGDRRGYDCLGTLLLEQSRLSDAVKVYKEGVKRNPRDADLWHGLASAYEKLDMHKEAGDARQRASRVGSEKNTPAPEPSPFLE
jgi:tetratricopeptide (TPR) repeat protein